MHYAFRDMFGKVKSCRWTDEEFESVVVGGRATFLLDDHGAFIKENSSLIGGSFKKAPRFAMKRAPHVELRIAPQRTPHRLDCGVVESVRPVALRRSDGKPSNLAATCPWGRVSQIRCPHAPLARESDVDAASRSSALALADEIECRIRS